MLTMATFVLKYENTKHLHALKKS